MIQQPNEKQLKTRQRHAKEKAHVSGEGDVSREWLRQFVVIERGAAWLNEALNFPNDVRPHKGRRGKVYRQIIGDSREPLYAMIKPETKQKLSEVAKKHNVTISALVEYFLSTGLESMNEPTTTVICPKCQKHYDKITSEISTAKGIDDFLCSDCRE